MDYISMPDGFFGEQNFLKRKYYIMRLWEIITKKGKFDGLHKQTVRTYFQKWKYFLFSPEKNYQKRKF